jgi:hypothetical protein
MANCRDTYNSAPQRETAKPTANSIGLWPAHSHRQGTGRPVSGSSRMRRPARPATGGPRATRLTKMPGGFARRLLSARSMKDFPEMPLTVELTNDLSSGPAYLFADWPNIAVSTFGAGVYTIWHKDGRFIYVGTSGRGMSGFPWLRAPTRHAPARTALGASSPKGLTSSYPRFWSRNLFVSAGLDFDDAFDHLPGCHTSEEFHGLSNASQCHNRRPERRNA